MSNLKSTIETLANEFTMRVISAMRSASIDELTELGGRSERARSGLILPVARGRRSGGGRLGRRSAADIGRMVDNIVAILQQHPDGLRAEQIREALACEAKELPRPLNEALSSGRITKSGQKRATTYFVAGRAGGGAAKGRGRRRQKRS